MSQAVHKRSCSTTVEIPLQAKIPWSNDLLHIAGAQHQRMTESHLPVQEGRKIKPKHQEIASKFVFFMHNYLLRRKQFMYITSIRVTLT
jgi:hypothetical protein